MSLLTNCVVTICPIEQAEILAVRQCLCFAGQGKRDGQDSEAHDEA